MSLNVTKLQGCELVYFHLVVVRINIQSHVQRAATAKWFSKLNSLQSVKRLK